MTDDGFEIMYENWPTILVFISLATQWRTELLAMSGERVWYGLPATEIEATVRLMGLGKDARTIFAGLRVMEQAALPLLNARKP